jgi:signal recognition particle subunit SEC65
MLRGDITTPIHHYLLYTMYMDWTERNKFRTSPKKKLEMKKTMEQLGLFRLLLLEGYKKYPKFEDRMPEPRFTLTKAQRGGR